MKNGQRIAIVVVILGALAGAWLLFGIGSGPERWLGYVEGESLYIAAPVSGRLDTLAVQRGAKVSSGDPLFSLDPVTADADTARLQAQLDATRAQAADLGEAKQRQAEIDVSRASEAAAAALLIKAEKDFERISALAEKGFASRAQLDSARAARDGARAALDQTRAQIRSGELTAGRNKQISAARSEVAAASAALRGQEQRRADIAPLSPAKGIVEQTYFDPGEWVPANSPIVSILPDDKRKLRFFVPEERVAALELGTTVRFTCDACNGERTARINYISPRAEFTPPVIYSERARAKLVFLVEAALPKDEKPLPPGLPVQVNPQ